MLHQRASHAGLLHPSSAGTGEISLPVLFENVHDTRRFFDEYCTAQYNNEPVYEFEGEAWFSLELYIRLRDRNNK